MLCRHVCLLFHQASEMSERFDLAHIESCMGGQLKAPLFDLETYGQRMKVGVWVLGHSHVGHDNMPAQQCGKMGVWGNYGKGEWPTRQCRPCLCAAVVGNGSWWPHSHQTLLLSPVLLTLPHAAVQMLLLT